MEPSIRTGFLGGRNLFLVRALPLGEMYLSYVSPILNKLLIYKPCKFIKLNLKNESKDWYMLASDTKK